MAKNTTPEQVAAKWSRNFGAAAQSVKDGVAGVTQAPSQAAIKQQDLMRQRVLDAIDSGKWARGLGKVSLQDWQNAMTTIGVPRMQSGAAKGQHKQQAFQQSWLPYIRGVSAQIASMPKGGIANAQARMMRNLEAAMSFKRS